jgi:innexin
MKNGHYKWMRFILKIAFSLIVTTRQYVGNPIDCVHTKDIPEDVLNTYCWIHSTYALKSMFLKKTGKEVPYPGVGNSEGKTEDRKVYKYYQWVCFCLFFQVINAAANYDNKNTNNFRQYINGSLFIPLCSPN